LRRIHPTLFVLSALRTICYIYIASKSIRALKSARMARNVASRWVYVKEKWQRGRERGGERESASNAHSLPSLR
jgi:hypothetical protein